MEPDKFPRFDNAFVSNIGKHIFATLVTEYAGIDLVTYWDTERAHVTQNQLRDIILEMTKCVATMHNHKITNRDIKNSNVTIDKDGTVRLIDFGLSTRKQKMTTMCGTLIFLSGELLGRIDPKHSNNSIFHEPYTYKVDFHSLAQTLRCLVYGIKVADDSIDIADDSIDSADDSIDIAEASNNKHRIRHLSADFRVNLGNFLSQIAYPPGAAYFKDIRPEKLDELFIHPFFTMNYHEEDEVPKTSRKFSLNFDQVFHCIASFSSGQSVVENELTSRFHLILSTGTRL